MTGKWIPKTEIGKKVEKGEIKSLEQIYKRNKPILEYQIVDKLLGKTEEEVLDVNRVTRITDSGRRMSFTVTAAVGDKKGHIGVGKAKGKEVSSTIDKAIREAKKNIATIKMGCGSWECGCGEKHSIPLAVEGKEGSVEIKIKPAPKGTGIVAGDTAKKIIELAGIKDTWTHARGHTATTVNFAKATIKALKKTRKQRWKE